MSLRKVARRLWLESQQALHRSSWNDSLSLVTCATRRMPWRRKRLHHARDPRLGLFFSCRAQQTEKRPWRQRQKSPPQKRQLFFSPQEHAEKSIYTFFFLTTAFVSSDHISFQSINLPQEKERQQQQQSLLLLGGGGKKEDQQKDFAFT